MSPIWHQLYAHRSEPAARAVLVDWLEENGRGGLGWLKRVAERDVATADDADTDAAADADADAAAATATADDDAAAVTDAADAADADTDAADAADDDDAAADDAAADDDDAAADDDDAAADTVANTRRFWRVEYMREGLLLIQIPGRYWGVTRVGWARRVEGDEWEWRGVTVVRTGAVRTLASLAAEGPGEDHVVTPMDEVTELLHRFTPRRVLLANPEKWGEHCPKPGGW